MGGQDKKAPGSPVQPLKTASKVLRMLDVVAGSPKPKRLSEICAETGLGRATAYQQLKTLVEAGWLATGEDGRYELSLKPLFIADAALRHLGFGDRVLPTLTKLMRDANETASLTVMQHGRPVIIQRVEVDRPIVARQNIGNQLDLFDSASGKIHIAFDDPDALTEIERLGRSPIENEEIEEIRKTHIAYSTPGSGLFAAASPVFDRTRRCVASLSIVGLHQDHIGESARKYLVAASTAISDMF